MAAEDKDKAAELVLQHVAGFEATIPEGALDASTVLGSGSELEARGLRGMAIEVRPATQFEDVKAVVGPKRPDANVCWCLSYRIPSRQNLELRGPERGELVRQLMG